MSDDLELLRRHDPAAGKTLTSFDRTRILLGAHDWHPRARPRLLVAMAVLVIIVAVAVGRHSREEAPRQIQYATPGGTRVVWTLNPKFHM